MPEPGQNAVKLARQVHARYCQHLSFVECEKPVQKLAEVIDEAQKAERARIIGELREWAQNPTGEQRYCDRHGDVWIDFDLLLAKLDEIEKADG